MFLVSEIDSIEQIQQNCSKRDPPMMICCLKTKQTDDIEGKI